MTRRSRPRGWRLLAGLLLASTATLLLPNLGARAEVLGSATPAPGPGASAFSGCPHQAGSGTSTLSLKVDGRQRTVVVHVPPGLGANEKVPLVLNMHGSGVTAKDQELFSGMDLTSDAEHFLVAYPQGLIPDGTGFDWNVPGVPLVGGRAVPKGAANDVTFLTDLVGNLAQRYCIDAHQVYATGFSGGARMASQLACDASTTFAAVAPVSGLRRPSPCKPARAVPVLAIHGTADPADPYQGHGQAYWVYSVPEAASLWAAQDRCSKAAQTSHPSAEVTLTSYGHCAGTAVVELYSITGEGHEWPDGPTLPSAFTRELGPQSNAINANSVIWSFFRGHAMS